MIDQFEHPAGIGARRLGQARVVGGEGAHLVHGDGVAVDQGDDAVDHGAGDRDRLLVGADVAPAARRPTRAALVDGEQAAAVVDAAGGVAGVDRRAAAGQGDGLGGAAVGRQRRHPGVGVLHVPLLAEGAGLVVGQIVALRGHRPVAGAQVVGQQGVVRRDLAAARLEAGAAVVGDRAARRLDAALLGADAGAAVVGDGRVDAVHGAAGGLDAGAGVAADLRPHQRHAPVLDRDPSPPAVLHGRVEQRHLAVGDRDRGSAAGDRQSRRSSPCPRSSG